MTRDIIDPNEVLASLGWETVGAPTPVLGGMDTAIWRFRTADGRLHALRLFRAEQAAAAWREQEAMTAARAGGVPVPVVEATGTCQDRPAMVLAWAPGVSLLDGIQRRPWLIWQLGRAFGEAQAHVHQVAAPPALRGGAPHSWLDWARKDEPALVERLLALPVSTDTLIHLDYHPLNVLVDGGRIGAVLDWTNAAAGDNRADLATTAAILLAAPVPAGPIRPLLKMARRLLYLAWRRGYEGAAGPVGDLTPFLALAGARMLREMAPRVGQFGDWVRPGDIEAIRRWTARRKHLAGVR